MRKFPLYLFIIMLTPAFGIAQKGIINGKVIDALTNTSIENASIILTSLSRSGNSDELGTFTFTGLKEGEYELIVSHVGYKTQKVIASIQKEGSVNILISLERMDLQLSEVEVSGKKSAALNTLSQVDIKMRPVNSSQDILRIVPGLFIAQHAGGGKAEQIFLRGYDIDHGTDINITVDGIPVNMVSHAHGQGYADLHFLIPETIEKVNFDKGPYHPSKGNMATAGYVDFQTRDFLTNNSVRLEAGNFNTKRIVSLIKVADRSKETSRQQLYFAGEYFVTDGFVESPQDFHRLNLLAKYNLELANSSRLTITGTAFDSKWNASGQIPQRAVDAGMITRFGSIDDTEGGNTSRYGIIAKFSKNWRSGWKTSDQLYFTHYRFNLYSNFTFFLNDPVNGDQINQQESRNIYGYNGAAAKDWNLGNKVTTTTIGYGIRYDDVKDIRLSNTKQREFISDVQKGDIRESNIFLFANQHFLLAEHLELDAGLRFDHFNFGYNDKLAGSGSLDHQQKSTINPKLTLNWTPVQKFRFYFNIGTGFHSNDTRVILDRSAREILPRVFGTDVGITWKPVKELLIRTAFWQLRSETEFVYVGDAGIVEPGGRTKRYGADMSFRYQPISWLYADLDLNFTRARSLDVPKGEDYVPLAPAFTSIGGLTAKMKNGLSASVRYRYIDDRPANETNSVRAEGYLIADAVLSWKWRLFEFHLAIENIFDIDWNEAQFDTESRLQFEPAPLSEIHFTPGTPRFLKGGVTITF